MDQCENCNVQIAPLSATYNVTDRCNFACPYCFTKENARSSSFEVAQATAEFLLKNKSMVKTDMKPLMWFFGGEPMLKFEEIIKPIVSEYKEKIDFGITTNGSLLSEGVVDFFYENNVEILLSIDGVQEVQDVQRPFKNGKGSFSEVIKKVPYLLLKYPNITFRATLTKHSIPFMEKTYDYANHLGFLKITFVINEYEEYTNDDFYEIYRQYGRIAVKMLEGQRLVCSDVFKVKEYLESKPENIMRCGYGTTACGVTVDGNLTPCQELNTYDGIVIGDVYSGINEKKRNKFLKTAIKEIEMPDWADDELKDILKTGTCPKKAYFEDNFKVSNARAKFIAVQRACFYNFSNLAKYGGNPSWRRFMYALD